MQPAALMEMANQQQLQDLPILDWMASVGCHTAHAFKDFGDDCNNLPPVQQMENLGFWNDAVSSIG